MIKRELVQTILRSFKKGFISIIYGPRQVGKTVLLQQLAEKLEQENILWFNGDTEEARESLGTTSQVKLSELVKNKEIIFIDEAQRIENIALSLKILVDRFPEKKIVVTGSSSLALTKGMQETLTGRLNQFKLYPLSTRELDRGLEGYQKQSLLQGQLIFGGYPYLLSLATPNEKKAYLKTILSDYLFMDLLILKDVSSPETLKKLTSLLSYQIGNEVSLNELASSLGIDVKTVGRYLSLLKQIFIIFELPSFSKNLRKELAKSKKYYFWDLGIRNAVIDQFSSLDLRPDTGALWENFLAVERMKKHEYLQIQRSYYFWRTYEKAEIDWIEIKGEELSAFEFKWKDKKIKTPKAFKEAYKREAFLVSKENYLEFIS